jgi:hypothetical protein
MVREDVAPAVGLPPAGYTCVDHLAVTSIAGAASEDSYRRIRQLQAITITWMIIEAIASLWTAVRARSPALLAFGGDSTIELLSAAVVLRRFQTHASEEHAERRAARIAGVLLIILTGYVLAISALTLLGYSEPKSSRTGIAILAVALPQPERSEREPDPAGDEIAFPVIQVVGITQIGHELEIAVLVCRFRVPLPESVANASLDKIAVIQSRIGECGRRMPAETRRKLRCALDLNPCTFIAQEVISENQRKLEQLHVVAGKELIVHEGGGKNDLPDLHIEPDGEVTNLKPRSCKQRILPSVIGGIVGQTNLAASHETRATLLCVAFEDGHLSVNAEL